MKSETFHERLKRLRTQKGLTMKEVARAIAVPETTYREWEYGRDIKGAEPYIKLAVVFGIGVHELLTGSKNDKYLVMDEITLLQKSLHRLKTQLESFF